VSKLGKTQLALLLIVDQATRTFEGFDELAGKVFLWEESISYVQLDGELGSLFMMTRDLKSLARLCELGLVRKRSKGYTDFYTITEAGRAKVEELRAKHDPSYKPPSTDFERIKKR
jgi:hypothetical protein